MKEEVDEEEGEMANIYKTDGEMANTYMTDILHFTSCSSRFGCSSRAIYSLLEERLAPVPGQT